MKFLIVAACLLGLAHAAPPNPYLWIQGAKCNFSPYNISGTPQRPDIHLTCNPSQNQTSCHIGQQQYPSMTTGMLILEDTTGKVHNNKIVTNAELYTEPFHWTSYGCWNHLMKMMRKSTIIQFRMQKGGANLAQYFPEAVPFTKLVRQYTPHMDIANGDHNPWYQCQEQFALIGPTPDMSNQNKPSGKMFWYRLWMSSCACTRPNCNKMMLKQAVEAQFAPLVCNEFCTVTNMKWQPLEHRHGEVAPPGGRGDTDMPLPNVMKNQIFSGCGMGYNGSMVQICGRNVSTCMTGHVTIEKTTPNGQYKTYAMIGGCLDHPMVEKGMQLGINMVPVYMGTAKSTTNGAAHTQITRCSSSGCNPKPNMPHHGNGGNGNGGNNGNGASVTRTSLAASLILPLLAYLVRQ